MVCKGLEPNGATASGKHWRRLLHLRHNLLNPLHDILEEAGTEPKTARRRLPAVLPGDDSNAVLAVKHTNGRVKRLYADWSNQYLFLAETNGARRSEPNSKQILEFADVLHESKPQPRSKPRSKLDTKERSTMVLDHATPILLQLVGWSVESESIPKISDVEGMLTEGKVLDMVHTGKLEQLAYSSCRLESSMRHSTTARSAVLHCLRLAPSDCKDVLLRVCAACCEELAYEWSHCKLHTDACLRLTARTLSALRQCRIDGDCQQLERALMDLHLFLNDEFHLRQHINPMDMAFETDDLLKLLNEKRYHEYLHPDICLPKVQARADGPHDVWRSIGDALLGKTGEGIEGWNRSACLLYALANPLKRVKEGWRSELHDLLLKQLMFSVNTERSLGVQVLPLPVIQTLCYRLIHASSMHPDSGAIGRALDILLESLNKFLRKRDHCSSEDCASCMCGMAALLRHFSIDMDAANRFRLEEEELFVSKIPDLLRQLYKALASSTQSLAFAPLELVTAMFVFATGKGKPNNHGFGSQVVASIAEHLGVGILSTYAAELRAHLPCSRSAEHGRRASSAQGKATESEERNRFVLSASRSALDLLSSRDLIWGNFGSAANHTSLSDMCCLFDIYMGKDGVLQRVLMDSMHGFLIDDETTMNTGDAKERQQVFPFSEDTALSLHAAYYLHEDYASWVERRPTELSSWCKLHFDALLHNLKAFASGRDEETSLLHLHCLRALCNSSIGRQELCKMHLSDFILRNLFGRPTFSPRPASSAMTREGAYTFVCGRPAYISISSLFQK